MAEGPDTSRLESTLDRLLVWIQAADQKGTIVLAMDTGMLGVLAALVPPPKSLECATVVLSCISAILLLVSGVLICTGTFPRVSGPKGSMVYFGGIVEYPREEFVAAVQGRTTAEYAKDLATQIHRNAEIAKEKFWHVRQATVFLVLAIVPWLVSVFMLYRNGAHE